MIFMKSSYVALFLVSISNMFYMNLKYVKIMFWAYKVYSFDNIANMSILCTFDVLNMFKIGFKWLPCLDSTIALFVSPILSI